jgi:hypothetical protein
MWRRVGPWVRSAAAVVLVLGMLCGASAVVTIPLMLALHLIVGGSAAGGYEEGGAYFVVAHGEARRVSAATYFASLAVEWSVFAAVACLGVFGLIALAAEVRARTARRS